MESAVLSPSDADHANHVDHVDALFARLADGRLDLDPDQGIRQHYQRLLADHVYRVAGFRCVYCGLDFLANLDALSMASRDHLFPRSQGGRSTEGNVVAACLTCQSMKAGHPYRTVNGARQALHLLRQRHARWFDVLVETYR